MGRSLQHLIFNKLRSFQGRNPKGAPRIPSRLPLLTNLNHFYPVAGARQGNKLPPSQSRLTGLGAGAAGIRSTANGYTRNCITKRGMINPPWLKFLRSRGFFQEAPCGVGQSPRSSHRIFSLRISVPTKRIGRNSPKRRELMRSLYLSRNSAAVRFVLMMVAFARFMRVLMTV